MVSYWICIIPSRFRFKNIEVEICLTLKTMITNVSYKKKLVHCFAEEINGLVYIWTDHSEAVAQRCSVKKMFLELLQNSQENTCARVSFLIKLQTSGLQLCLKRDSGTSVFCEFCEISKNNSSYITTLVGAFDHWPVSAVNYFHKIFYFHYFFRSSAFYLRGWLHGRFHPGMK